VEDPDRITIRQIAEQAEVGIGLVNYHFQSKENLFKQAVDTAAGQIEDRWQHSLDPTIADPVERLKAMLKANARVGTDNLKYARISIQHELLHGEISVPQVILPVLREIYAGEKDEPAVRMIAFSLVTTLQVIFLRQRAFRRCAGIAMFDEDQRDLWIEQLVDQIL